MFRIVTGDENMECSVEETPLGNGLSVVPQQDGVLNIYSGVQQEVCVALNAANLLIRIVGSP
ncbi:hypothetical protein B0E48_03885 [Rhodanobacter sp. C03]|nr:hypothetical protein B0E48_03885 [Rhodanobacter sp. C03]